MSEHQDKRFGFATISFCVLGLWLVLLPGIASAQQNASESQEKTSSVPAGSVETSKKNISPEEQRQVDLRADTEKLYQLTQELKAEVAKSNKDTLSVSVVKKAQEIERLAKSIKERSRTR